MQFSEFKCFAFSENFDQPVPQIAFHNIKLLDSGLQVIKIFFGSAIFGILCNLLRQMRNYLTIQLCAKHLNVCPSLQQLTVSLLIVDRVKSVCNNKQGDKAIVLKCEIFSSPCLILQINLKNFLHMTSLAYDASIFKSKMQNS